MSENVTIVNQKSSAIIFSFPSNHNKSYLCKLRHRKKVLKQFRKFISQDQHIRTLIWSAYYLFLKFLFKTQLCSYSKYDLNDNRKRRVCQKIKENSHLCFSAKCKWYKKSAKIPKASQISNIQLASFKIPTAWGLNSASRLHIIFWKLIL